MARARRFAYRIAILALTLALGACSGKTGPADLEDEEPGEEPGDSITTSKAIGGTGGSVSLSDGTTVVFPPGAVSGSTYVTLTKQAVASFVDGGGAADRAVLGVSATVAQFQQDVEIRLPLPAGMTPADSLRVLAGVINDTTGAIKVVHPAIRVIGQRPFLVVSTQHFSNWLFEWLSGGKTPPASAGPLEVPYYGQGESKYCWAASLQMVTRAVRQDETFTIPQIVGRTGVDEGGITSISFRVGPTIAALVKERTGVKPTRQTWDYVNGNRMKEYLKREIGLNGRPVALFATVWNHAVVVVGYNGDTFYIHDPASTNLSSVGYAARPWSAIGGAMGITDNFVTLVVPAPLASGGSPLRVNLMSNAMRADKPRADATDTVAVYAFRWDHTSSLGYAFQHITAGVAPAALPGGTQTLHLTGDLQLSNASRSGSVEASVWLDISAVGAPSGVGHYSARRTISVGPNSVVNFNGGAIPVDTFRYNRSIPSEYLLTLSALVGGTKVDGQSVLFKVDPAVPELTALEPASGMPGDRVRIRGKRLGWSRTGNKVSLAGTEIAAQDIIAWANDQITIRIPSSAKSGEVVVTRGEVASNRLPFTVKQYVTSQSFNLTWGSPVGNVLVTAEIAVEALVGGWSSVVTRRDRIDPQSAAVLYFGTAPPAAGGNQYKVTVTPVSATTNLNRTPVFWQAEWVISSQTPGLPDTRAKGESVQITEMASPYAKQAALWLYYRLISTTLKDTTVAARDGLFVSFSPGHAGMLPGPPVLRAGGR